MRRIVTAAQAREIDRIAIEGLEVPSLLLMEHAGRAVADAAQALVAETGRVFVVCGGGNNGGDGYVAARLLLARGLQAQVVAVVPPDRLHGDAAAASRIFIRYGGAVDPLGRQPLGEVGAGDVVVDALLGTGLSRAPQKNFARAIEAVNEARARGASVVAVDLPSGVCADTGRALGAAVGAERTVTFGAWKRGLVCHPGAALAGAVEVAEISWPPGVVESMRPALCLLDDAFVRSKLPLRASDSHKGSFGHVLVVAGSAGKTGAASLAGLGALVGGAGLVTVAARGDVLPLILAAAPELMGHALPGTGPLGPDDLPALLEAAEGKDALLVGPGIPRGEETGQLLLGLRRGYAPPMVLDADALNALAGLGPLPRQAGRHLVLTPHPGELARLLGSDVRSIQGDRIETARKTAQAWHGTVVLKGAGTVVADPDGDAAVCPTGNPGMATGGSGDVLGGLLAALLAQGLSPGDAARVAVYVHGLAGDRRAQARGRMGLLASDLLDGIAEVWASWND